MAYENVGTPRFYVDQLITLKNLGILSSVDDNNLELIGLDPQFAKDIDRFTSHGGQIIYNYNVNIPFNKMGVESRSYYAVLNFKSPIQGGSNIGNPANAYSTLRDVDNVLNSNMIDSSIVSGNFPVNNGCSIFTGNSANFDELENTQNPNLFQVRIRNLYEESIGCISAGFYYDMPFSPDLNISMEVEFEKGNTITTVSGKTIKQKTYKGSPWWYDLDGNKIEPWAIGDSENTTKRNGRRIWLLKFSYLADKNLFPANSSSSDYIDSFDHVAAENISEVTYQPNIVQDSVFETTDKWVRFNNDNNYIRFINDKLDFTNIPATGGISAGGAYNIFSNNNGGFVQKGKYRIKFTATGGSFNGLLMLKPVVLFNDILSFGNFITGDNGERFIYKNGFQSNANAIFLDEDEVVNYDFLVDIDKDAFNGIAIFGGAYSSTSGRFNGTIDDFTVELANETSTFNTNIDNGDNFISAVYNKISNGEKFIFQPDNTSNNPSDFAICIIDKTTLNIKQSALNVYDVSMKIKEVW